MENGSPERCVCPQKLAGSNNSLMYPFLDGHGYHPFWTEINDMDGALTFVYEEYKIKKTGETGSFPMSQRGVISALSDSSTDGRIIYDFLHGILRLIGCFSGHKTDSVKLRNVCDAIYTDREDAKETWKSGKDWLCCCCLSAYCLR